MSDQAYVIGVGDTEYSRRSPHTVEALAVHAVRAAAADAGIEPREIDGVIDHVGHVEAESIISNLALPDVRFMATDHLGGASCVSNLQLAGLAVRGGAAKYVVAFRARKSASGPRKHERPSFLPGQAFRRNIDYVAGWNTPAERYSMLCRRYMHERGLTREHLGEVALAARAHANLNPRAQMHDRTLTMEQYLNGRMISDPYHLFDCCLETDGATAVIVSAAIPSGQEQRAVGLVGAQQGHPDLPDDMANRPEFMSVGLDKAAPRLWAETGLGPEDMDAAMIYDCFTFEVVHQLESAGFVAPDELAKFLESGAIRLGGQLPVNTHGGLLSEGHLAGMNHIVEAVRQLRGESGPRQVEGARHIAVTGWGNFSEGAIAVLGKAA